MLGAGILPRRSLNFILPNLPPAVGEKDFEKHLVLTQVSKTGPSLCGHLMQGQPLTGPQALPTELILEDLVCNLAPQRLKTGTVAYQTQVSPDSCLSASVNHSHKTQWHFVRSQSNEIAEIHGQE